MRYGLGGAFLDGEVLDGAVVPRKEPFPRSWLRHITRSAPENLVWALGDGDSMDPTIRDGEVVLIDLSRDTLRSRDAIWAATMGEIGMIKRLRPLPDGRIQIMSDNKDVPDDYAADDELHIIGRVVAVVRGL